MPNDYVLLVEDDVGFASELRNYLNAHGIRTIHATSTDAALEQLDAESPAGIILDQFVGKTDTLSWLGQLRARYQGGIMFLSGNDEVTDRIVGLEMGAADFVNKSVMPRELLARVRALIRRPAEGDVAKPLPVTESRNPNLGKWHLDVQKMELFRPDGSIVPLTGAEFETLRYLDSRQGHAVSRDELAKVVLHRNYNPLDRSVDNLIFRLRKKLSTSGQASRRIKTVRGDGYVFVGFDAADTVPA